MEEELRKILKSTLWAHEELGDDAFVDGYDKAIPKLTALFNTEKQKLLSELFSQITHNGLAAMGSTVSIRHIKQLFTEAGME